MKPLWKHAYSNILKISPPKNKSFQIKNSDIFHISAQNIDCGYSLEPPRRGGSNEYPQSMFLSRNKKKNVYPCKPQFYYIKVGFKGGSILYRYVFVMLALLLWSQVQAEVKWVEKQKKICGKAHDCRILWRTRDPSWKHAYIDLTPLNPNFIQ